MALRLTSSTSSFCLVSLDYLGRNSLGLIFNRSPMLTLGVLLCLKLAAIKTPRQKDEQIKSKTQLGAGSYLSQPSDQVQPSRRACSKGLVLPVRQDSLVNRPKNVKLVA
ncbi:hypothetical protein Adt_26380 [Abeliophyllum distichum]|uniref:Uncharacterized protein n=1 Tax=Abeliophyllum distichum TaxID=126358 RepID=A0ABD1RQR0_9LAMI